MAAGTVSYTHLDVYKRQVHDLGYEHFPEAHPRRQLAYLRWSTRHNARVARRVIADSRATADDLVAPAVSYTHL